MNKYNRFQKGSGCFICELCGKRTRKTEGSNINEFYCADCIDQMEQENAEENEEVVK